MEEQDQEIEVLGTSGSPLNMAVPLWEVLLMVVSMVIGAGMILAACVFTAAGLSNLIDPAPVYTPEERVRRAERTRIEDDRLERHREELERAQGREPIDSTRVSFPVFGWTFLGCLVLMTSNVVLTHTEDPGTGFPLELLLRPLWVSFAAASVAGIAAGAGYRRWFRRLPVRRQREVKDRLRAKDRHAFYRRLDRERRNAWLHRGSRKRY